MLGVPTAWSQRKPPVAMNASERSRTRRIAAPVGRLTCRVAEAERDSAHDPEDHEVERIVLYMRIKLRPKQQRNEPNQGECGGGEPHDDEGTRARPLLKLCPRAIAPDRHAGADCYSPPLEGPSVDEVRAHSGYFAHGEPVGFRVVSRQRIRGDEGAERGEAGHTRPRPNDVQESAGWMFWLTRNTLFGSYSALMLASRS